MPPTESRPWLVLDCPMRNNDAGAATIGDYLIRLLDAVWSEGEGFSGKRPFGNSGWEHELYRAMIRAGILDGSLDADGYVESYDMKQAGTLVREAILSLYDSSQAGGGR